MDFSTIKARIADGRSRVGCGDVKNSRKDCRWRWLQNDLYMSTPEELIFVQAASRTAFRCMRISHGSFDECPGQLNILIFLRRQVFQNALTYNGKKTELYRVT
jgi:hypothetical protein